MFVTLGPRTQAALLGLCIAAGAGRARAAAEPPAPLAPASDGSPSDHGSPPPTSEPGADEASVLAPAIVELAQSPPLTRWAGRVSIGSVYRWAFDESMVGGALEGELGAQNPRLNGGVRLRIEVGKMFVDLPYQVVSFGPFIWLPPLGQRVRVGFGVDAGALVISRRTRPGSTLWTILMGGEVRMSVDLLRIGPRGLHRRLWHYCQQRWHSIGDVSQPGQWNGRHWQHHRRDRPRLGGSGQHLAGQYCGQHCDWG